MKNLVARMVVVLAACCAVSPGPARAAPPVNEFGYSGYLYKANGAFESGSVEMAFRFFDAVGVEINPAVSDTHMVNVEADGYFATIVAVTDASIFRNQVLMEVRVTADAAPLSPRVRLNASPNALGVDWSQVRGVPAAVQAGTPAPGSANYVQIDPASAEAGGMNISGDGVFGGKVGIGTGITQPKAPLHVAKDITTPQAWFGASYPLTIMAARPTLAFNARWDGSSWRVVGYANGGSYGAAMDVDHLSGRYRFFTSGVAGVDDATTVMTEKMTLLNNGRLGIGTSTPVQALDVVGDAVKSVGGTAWAASSDQRLKRNIRTLEPVLLRYLALRGVTFEWSESGRAKAAPGVHKGFIAQEVEKVFPEWVHTGGDGFKVLAPEGFEAVTVEAVRTVNQKVDAVTAENVLLRKRVSELEEKLAAAQKLEARLAAVEARLAAGVPPGKVKLANR